MVLIGNINGSTYYDIDLGRVLRTHINDFSTRFKTMAGNGTMWMTHSPRGSEYIKAFFDDGNLKVAIHVDGVSYVYRKITQLNMNSCSQFPWSCLPVSAIDPRNYRLCRNGSFCKGTYKSKIIT